MDAIIGRFRVGLKKTGLTLTHETGISFDLTLEESLGLFRLLQAYYETFLSLKGDREQHTEELLRVESSGLKTDERF